MFFCLALTAMISCRLTVYYKNITPAHVKASEITKSHIKHAIFHLLVDRVLHKLR